MSVVPPSGHWLHPAAPATVTTTEPQRAGLLRDLGILDSTPEASFDGLTRAAALLTGCPIALVSLLDVERQWFKSRHGLAATETPIASSFCAHAARQPDLFEVEDTWADPRFAGNPLVTGDPGIRFYAGQPLVLDGVVLGTLCVIDTQPRRLSAQARLVLEGLAHAVEGLIEARQALAALHEQQVTQTALRAERDAAQQAARLRSEVVSSVSHELRTPLNAVVGFAQLLLIDPQQVTLYAQHIQRAGTLLLALVNDMLELARLETGHARMDLRPVSSASLMQRCIDLLKPEASRRGVQIHAHTEPGADIVMAHMQGLTQALLNLASNALKFSPPGSAVSLRARASATDGNGDGDGDGDHIEISVSDHGPGIAPALLSLLFVPFSQLPGNRTQGGTGLGLAISRQLVQAMGGEISVQSALGQGSTFTITLRAAEPGIPPVAESVFSLLDEPAVPPSATLLRVLYIEDDPVNVLLLEHMLAHFGPLDMSHAATAAAGRLAAQGGYFDLILLDMNLPDGHGLDVLAELRASAHNAEVPIVALSADALPSSISAARAAGFDDYLTKPINMAVLERLVARLR